MFNYDYNLNYKRSFVECDKCIYIRYKTDCERKRKIIAEMILSNIKYKYLDDVKYLTIVNGIGEWVIVRDKHFYVLG